MFYDGLTICHSRAGGNPDGLRERLDSRLRGNDKRIADYKRRALVPALAALFIITAAAFAAEKRLHGTDGLTFVKPSLGRVSSGYGRRYGRFHSGLDIDDSRGRDVRASESGEVVFSGRKGRCGRTVIIDHGHGWTTLYCHNRKNYVKTGDMVTQGQQIARMGASGKATGRHVHFEIRYKGKSVDPMKFLGKR